MDARLRSDCTRFKLPALFIEPLEQRHLLAAGTTNLGQWGEDVALQLDGKALVIAHRDSDVDVLRFNPDATVDTSFAANGLLATQLSEIHALKVQPDGDFLIAGSMTDDSGQMHGAIARYSPDGSIDSSFADAGIAAPAILAGRSISKLAIDATGRILAGCNRPSLSGDYSVVVQFDPNGALDTSFGSGGAITRPNQDLYALSVAPDSTILVGGYDIARYTSNGTLDPTFGNGGVLSLGAKVMGFLADGRIVLAGLGYDNDIEVYRPDGTLDTLTGAGVYYREPTDIAVEGNHWVVLSTETEDHYLADDPSGLHYYETQALKYTIDGHGWESGYAQFGGYGAPGHNGTDYATGIDLLNGKVAMTGGVVEGVPIVLSAEAAGSGTSLEQPSPYMGTPALPGKIIEAENFDYGGPGVSYADTTLENQGLSYRTTSVDVEPSSKDSGGFNVGWTQPGEWLEYTINAPSVGDYQFTISAASLGMGGSFHLEADGVPGPSIRIPNTGTSKNWRLINAGTMHLDRGEHALRLVMDTAGASGDIGNFDYLQFDPYLAPPSTGPGTIDPTFGTNGSISITTPDYEPVGPLIEQPDGKLLVTFPHEIRRLNSDGTPDLTFADNGILQGFGYALALQPDGKFLTQSETDASIVRFNPDGTPDPTFKPAAAHFGAGLYLEPDGSIVNISIASRFFLNGTRSEKFSPDGTPDPTAHNLLDDNLARGYVPTGVIPLAGGRFLIEFQTDTDDLSEYNDPGLILALLNPDLSIEKKVVIPSGFHGVHGRGLGIGLQPDGKIIVGGEVDSATMHFLRFNADLSPDTTFGNNGRSLNIELADGGRRFIPNGLLVQPNGKILVVGWTNGADPLSTSAAARFNPDGSIDSSFGTDGILTLSSTQSAATTAIVRVSGKIDISSSGPTITQLNGDGPFSRPYLFTPFSPGQLIQSEDFDDGGEGVSYHDTTPANQGGQYRVSTVDIAYSGEDDTFGVGWTLPGEWLNYTATIPADGDYTFSFRVASDGQGGTFHLESDGQDVTGPLTVPNTGGWTVYQTLTSAPAHLSAGQHVLKLVMDFDGATGAIGNFNYFRFDPATAPPHPTGTGLSATYFNNMDFTAPALTRLDPAVDFNWAFGSPDPSIDPDTFSVKWTGFIQAPSTGVYTFYTSSDDGARLIVNGQTVIDHLNPQALSDWSGSITLTAGQKVPIELDFFDRFGEAEIHLSWSSASFAKQVVPTSALFPTDSQPQTFGGTGLSAYYTNHPYSNYGGDDFNINRIDPGVDFNWGDGSPGPGLNAGDFGVDWTGFVEAPTTGLYQFYTTVDGGARLTINGQTLFDQTNFHGALDISGEIALTAGQKVPIELDYYAHDPNSEAHLAWSGPGIAREIIPDDDLFAASPDFSRSSYPWLLPNGKTLTIGSVYDYYDQIYQEQVYGILLERLNPNGSIDTTFGASGFVHLKVHPEDYSSGINDIASAPDGSIAIAGTSGLYNWVALISPDGQQTHIVVPWDSNYGNSARSISFWRGKIVVGGVGRDAHFMVSRLNPDLTRDTSFGDRGDAIINFTDLLPSTTDSHDALDGMVVAGDGTVTLVGKTQAGYSVSQSSPIYYALASLTPTGQLNPDFTGGGRVVYASSLQPNSTYLPFGDVAVAPDGTLLDVEESDSTIAAFTPTGLPASGYQGAGLTATYFNRPDFSGFSTTRIDPTVNFDWGTGAPLSDIPSDQFSVRWTGQFLAAQTGTYTFTTSSDDGARLTLNGQILIDHLSPQPLTDWSGQINLVAGQRYTIQLDYFDRFGEAVSQLFYAAPGNSRQIIPQALLFRE